MPYVRVAHRAAPVVPNRPVLPIHQAIARLPVKARPVARRFLPILQPPTFPIQSDFIYEDEEEKQQDVTHNYPTTADNERNKKTTKQISVRIPTFIPQQNYPKQPLPYLSIRSIRHAEPKYSPHLYSIR